MTVLATSVYAAPGADVPREVKVAARYKGPFYIDWDAKDGDLQGVIVEVNHFLDRLKQMGVDLRSIRIFLTGGRGVHVEVPAGTFMETVAPEGVVGLPGIYKEMMYALCTDSMDSNIYSGGRGRAWRVPNAERENHKYKVAVDVDTIRDMTPELYEILVSSPQPDPEWNPPTLCTALALIYERAVAKIHSERGRQRGSGRNTKGYAGNSQDAPANTTARFIRAVADAALEHMDTLLPRWFPDGCWEGGTYVPKNPRRDDKKPGSFKIFDDGGWIDFAHVDHKGGDLSCRYWF
jgi:hypothetical protein